MSRPRSISDVINGRGVDNGYAQVAIASKKARRKREREPQAPPIGHYLAVMVYEGEEHLETLFIEHLDISGRHTVFHFTKSHIEVFPAEVESMNIGQEIATVFYKNNTSLQIMRIS